jgi:hypothetical protein
MTMKKKMIPQVIPAMEPGESPGLLEDVQTQKEFSGFSDSLAHIP